MKKLYLMVGVSGMGKTTLTSSLGEKYNVVHIDLLHDIPSELKDNRHYINARLC